MEQLLKAVSGNFGAILSGLFAIFGVLLGWLLTLLTTKYQNRIQLTFLGEGTANIELVERELRTKTSLSEYSIKIYNTGKTACFLRSFCITRKRCHLVECYDIDSDYGAIAPNSSILYTLMQQDASELQRNYSEYYKKPNKLYLRIMRLLGSIPIIRNHIVDPLFRQGECEVIAYTINGKRIFGKIDLPLLYIRHTAKDSIVEV